MESHSKEPVAIDILHQLKQACQPGTDYLTLEKFIEIALYHPEFGYYNRDNQRIGRRPEADFYTSSSMGPMFSGLVIESIIQLLNAPPEEYVFIEAGPETESGILGHQDSSPFKSIRLIRPGDPYQIPPRSIVFSNELFDAQPFRRLIFNNSSWHEMGVKISSSHLEWKILDLQVPIPELPSTAPDGYIIDWPGKAHILLETIVRQPWNGLFVAFDYGMDSPTVFQERPQGTGRTYSNHKMGSHLLERPGEIDLTCHVIWDIMENILQSNRFSDIQLFRQETFFMKFARNEIQRILESGSPGFSREKQSLMELVHPENMGHQFQVLCGHRMEN